MMFKGRNGKIYNTIEPAIGRGGEGSVFKLSGMNDYVLKLFVEKERTETRHRKLLAMIDSPMPDDAMQQITWPTDVVYDNGQFVGYVMPAIRNNEDLNVMYSDKYSCTLSEKITIAKNLCSALNAVHNAGQVCGDLNPKNICVDPVHAIVTLVDTDSYHITDPNDLKVYRCNVGLPEYLPKEIQIKMKNGVTLKNAPLPTFTKETDLFALAVHIFALLMNGCHPFACAVNNSVNIGPLTNSQPSVVAPQPIENICNGFFPFTQTRAGISIPQYAPDFSVLPTDIQALFLRAFVKGNDYPAERPDTVEWYNALTKMQNNLRTCNVNKRHMYSSHLSECPWCKIESKMRMLTAPRLAQTSINMHSLNQVTTNAQSINSPVGNASPNQYGYTVSQGGLRTQGGKKHHGGWIALGVIALIIFAVIKSNSTTGNTSSTNTVYTSQTDSTQRTEATNTKPSEASSSNSTRTSTTDYQGSSEQKTETVSTPKFSVISGDSFSGNLKTEKQEDEYRYTPSLSGRYRFDFDSDNVQSDYRFYMYSSDGAELASTYYSNGGKTVDLNAGETYSIKVKQYSGNANYTITIGVPNNTSTINGTSFAGSITFKDQEDIYTYTAPISGRYRFDFDSDNVQSDYRFYMYSANNSELASTYYSNGGKTVDLNAGETYSIKVKQYSGNANYTITIGVPNDTSTINGTTFAGSIAFKDQEDIYTYTAPRTGRYRFDFNSDNVQSDYRFYMYSANNSELASTYYSNGGKTVDLNAGETYRIRVKQYSGNANYSITIGVPNDPGVINGSAFSGNLTFKDQEDLYTYTAPVSGRYRFDFSCDNVKCEYRFYMYSANNSELASTYSSNGSKNVDLTAGEVYTIKIKQYSGTMHYDIAISNP